jgi:hypothetical protein
VEDSWTIRNMSYELRVAPLSEGSEMLMVRPENVDFVFPTGRYALVIKGQKNGKELCGHHLSPIASTANV